MTSRELIDKALELSRADDCIVLVEEGTTANLRWANNSLTTSGVAHNRGIVIIAIKDRRVGIVSRSYVEPDALAGLVAEAEAACAAAPPAEDYAELVAGTETPKDWGDEAITTSAEVFARLVPELATACEAAQSDGECLFGYAEHQASTTYMANSRGLKRRHNQLKGQIEITAKTADFTSSAWVGQATTDFANVDTKALVARLRQRLEWSKTKLELPAGPYDTLLEPSAVADLMIYAYWTASSRDAAEGRTVFSKPGGTRIGEMLAPKGLSMFSDPHEADLAVADFELVGASSSYASVFDNGLALQRTDWIKDGRLEHMITPRATAEALKIEPRPYIDNLVITSDGAGSTEDLIKKVKRGLLVTCLWYIREVDPQRLLLTGLTRDGVFLIEDGQVKGAVNNFRFNMSPVEMLSHINDSGATVPTLAREWGDYFTFSKMPPMVIGDFNMSSVSKAT